MTNNSGDAAAGLFIILLFLVLALVGFCLYITPTIVAFTRKHRQRVPILVINFFLGWSVVAWVLTLAWSLSNDVETPQPVPPPVPPGFH
ncbi:MAG: superinfection immunity protein [Acidobacteriales bacterium]|nr:superinfection immunity protein [Terriglobales bacterium]